MLNFLKSCLSFELLCGQTLINVSRLQVYPVLVQNMALNTGEILFWKLAFEVLKTSDICKYFWISTANRFFTKCGVFIDVNSIHVFVIKQHLWYLQGICSSLGKWAPGPVWILQDFSRGKNSNWRFMYSMGSTLPNVDFTVEDMTHSRHRSAPLE